MPVTLSNTITAPVDSVAFDLLYDPTAVYYTGAASALCWLREGRIRAGKVHVTAYNCGAPLHAGAMIDAKFTGLVSPQDTIYTQVAIDSVTFYPTGVIAGSGCSTPLTINPLCGLKGVIAAGATSLAQNYPNPFSTSTNIEVRVPNVGAATLKVYNMLGEEVTDLSNELTSNGTVMFTDGTNKTGVYYYVLQTASGRMTRQMFIVK
jgi:hypothetical protein